MKAFSHFSLLLAAVMLLASNGFAQKKLSLDEQFNEISKLSKSKKTEDRDKAYNLSKSFLAEFGKETNPNVAKVRLYVVNVSKDLMGVALEKRKYVDAFALGDYLLDLDAHDLTVYLYLSFAGFQNFIENKDKSFNRDTMEYIGKALAGLDSTPLTNYYPYADKADAFGNLNYYLGIFADKDMRAAATHFQKTLTVESSRKKDLYPYAVIAAYYETAYNTRLTALKAATNLTDAQADAERKALVVILTKLVDVDARMVVLAEALKHPQLAAFRDTFYSHYTAWKRSPAGADEFLASIASTPIPAIE